MIKFYIELIEYSEPRSELRETYVSNILKNCVYHIDYKDTYNKLISIEVIMQSDRETVKKLLSEAGVK